MIVFAPQHSASGTRAPGHGIDSDGFHRRKINHDAVVAYGATGDVVAAAPNRDRQGAGLRELHGGNDVGNAGSGDDGERTLVDHTVPDLARLVVCFAAAQANPAADIGLQCFEVGFQVLDINSRSHRAKAYYGISIRRKPPLIPVTRVRSISVLIHVKRSFRTHYERSSVAHSRPTVGDAHAVV